MAMWLSLAPAYKRAGSLAITAVILWLGGFGCSLCCATGATDSCCLKAPRSSTGTTTSAVGAASCNASAACSCGKSQKIKRQIALTGDAIGRQGAIGCTLLPSQLDGVTAQVRIADTLVILSELPAPLLTPSGHTRTPSLSETPPLNRGGTGLRCCVLLI